ncbi:helix-turn-helix domain-containing protein [Aeromicrobium chenweiae]|uniref:AraC-like ligand-binding domain-containing protein n=1 Tax=Aeromicrobium chenweiae TaxID=2079793 RepID=UPI001092071D|nr:helix-turn-helix domain-containing protein [Aeromicrobium chenweiae]TGN31762.1 helix-turn-helix domain-containing protein [Aeromicrobium chenweiae]
MVPSTTPGTRPAPRLARSTTNDSDEYRSMLAAADLSLDVSPRTSGKFHGSVQAYAIDGLAIMRVSSVEQDVARTHPMIGSFPTEVLKVLIEREGSAGIRQHEREGILSPGCLTIYDTTRPYDVRQFAPFVADAVLIPRDRLPIRNDVLATLQRTPLSATTGAGAIFDSYLTQLWDRLPECSAPATSRLLSVLVELLAAAVVDVAPEPLSDHARQVTVMTWIGMHLSDPDLSPPAVAAATGLSLRYLHRLFAETGVTVAGYIRSERLRHIKRDLENPHLRHRTIAAIGAQWGIPDPAHLSRLFRSAFGLSPRDVRHLA